MIRVTIALILLFHACGERPKETPAAKNMQQNEDPLIRANKQLVKEESRNIDNYIRRRGWDMKETGTGLRYMIYENGKGVKAQTGQIALIDFTVTLLDGTECYSSKNSGPQEFRIGQDNVESGLHEALLLMHVGDKGKFILPPHLAHGLIGDMNKIPARSTIIYDVHLLSLR